MLKNFQTPSIFLGLFLRKLDVQDFQSFSESLPWRLPEFDADAQVNRGLPQNAPPDAPRVRFGSKDGRLLLELGPAKLHLRMMPGEVTQGPQGHNVQTLPVDRAFEVFIPQAMRIHSTLSEHFGAKATRVGVVTDMIAPVPSSACQRMQSHVLNGKNLFGDRLQDIQIQTLSRATVGETGVNRRISLRPLRTQGEGGADLLFNVNVDINTLAEEPYDLNAADLEKFLKNVAVHLENDIPLLRENVLFE